MMFVDPDARRIFVRREDGVERYLPYDLLIGADGIRSAVRAGLIANHRDFECSVSDIFSRFKSVHVALPPALAANTMVVMPQCLPGMNGIGLPETGGKINISMGYQLSTPCDEALRSTDAAVVAAYLQEKFKPSELPWDEFARQWVGQAWSQTGQVHCSSYHSSKLQLLIMGDAAHATSPAIGMGMNTALADAAALDELLDAHADALDQVLPAFSEARVKEGNALTDIAFYANSFSPAQGVRVILAQLVRGFLSKHLGPSLVAPEPMNELGMGAKLSEMYAELVRIGRLPAVRAVNDAARRRHFELRTGMVKARPSRLPAALGAASALAGLAAGVAALMATQAVSKPLMEPAGGMPLLEVCGDPHKFAASGLHAFEPMLGGSFVCLITQFLHALVLEPAGLLSWGLTIGLALPVSVLWNAEAGRTGASGLVRWPTLLGLLGQFLGISVVFPALWLPAAWYGKGDGAVSPARAYASIALAAPFISLTVALFTLDPTSRAWTVCAGLLGGPAIALLPLLLNLVPAPAVAVAFDEFPSAGALVAKQAAAGAKALGHAYALAGVLAFMGYAANVYLASLSYTSLGAACTALWAEATPAVAFMTIDAGVLFLGLLLHLASTAPAEAVAALAASLLLGPGAACALLLHRRETHQHAEASAEAKMVAALAGKKQL
mmetsp:Transcript_12103/g.28492  ORF Transcript_12103/g.28492 Transcript_12103/m.28492 type:complete len:668 (+) Transcript_12103:329-2332(+)